jgi:thioredoxin 1
MIATKENFEIEVLKEGLVVADFWATWCGPCKMMAPILESFTKEKGIKLAKIDVDAEPELAQMFNIMAIPTILIFQNGEVMKQIVGAVPRAALEFAVKEIAGLA